MRRAATLWTLRADPSRSADFRRRLEPIACSALCQPCFTVDVFGRACAYDHPFSPYFSDILCPKPTPGRNSFHGHLLITEHRFRRWITNYPREKTRCLADSTRFLFFFLFFPPRRANKNGTGKAREGNKYRSSVSTFIACTWTKIGQCGML